MSDRLLSAALLLAALACGSWAVWPQLFPEPRAPQVTSAFLPPTGPLDPAPSYATTASVAPLISGRLNINSATEEQLEALPKVGPAMAKRLLAARPYRSLNDLDHVKGVGPKLLATLAPLVTF